MSVRAALLTVSIALIVGAVPAAASADSFLGPTSINASGPLANAGLPETLVGYDPDPAETPRVTLSQTATDLVVTSTDARNWDVELPCIADSATVAHCPLDDLDDPQWIGVFTAEVPAGPLTLQTDPSVTARVLAVGDDGASADRVFGGPSADVLAVGPNGEADGGAGNDVLVGVTSHVGILRGGPGDDQLYDAADAQGGDGNDIIKNSLKADGGAGNDAIIDVLDGRGGDGDDTLRGASLSSPVLLDGGPGNDDLAGGGPNAQIHGGDGNDTLTECGNCVSAGATLSGDGGNDLITGYANGATLDGGDGADTLRISRLRVFGAPARVADPIRGGAGDDTIDSRETVAGPVDCGDGVDTVHHDATDTLTACENDLDPPSVPKQQPPAPGPVKAVGKLDRLRLSRTGTLTFSLVCPPALACRVNVVLQRGRTQLAQKVVTFAGTKAVTLKLKAATLKQIRKRGSLKASLLFGPMPGSGTQTMPAARTTTLLAPKKAKKKHHRRRHHR